MRSDLPLDLTKSHRPHLPSLSISARLFCPGNTPIELHAEEANKNTQERSTSSKPTIHNVGSTKMNFPEMYGFLRAHWLC